MKQKPDKKVSRQASLESFVPNALPLSEQSPDFKKVFSEFLVKKAHNHKSGRVFDLIESKPNIFTS